MQLWTAKGLAKQDDGDDDCLSLQDYDSPVSRRHAMTELFQ